VGGRRRAVYSPDGLQDFAYRIDWEGEYENQKRADERLLIVLPITILIIFIILYTMFKSFKWAFLILANVAMARIFGAVARAG
jgi:cobalt-zinc-cadmium resistance protein CzcA